MNQPTTEGMPVHQVQHHTQAATYPSQPLVPHMQLQLNSETQMPHFTQPAPPSVTSQPAANPLNPTPEAAATAAAAAGSTRAV